MSCSDFRQLSQMNKQITYVIRIRAAYRRRSALILIVPLNAYYIFLRSFLAVVFLLPVLNADIKVISTRRNQV